MFIFGLAGTILISKSSFEKNSARIIEELLTDLSINRNYGMTLICARQLDRALIQAKKTYVMDPDFLLVKQTYFYVLLEKSMFQEILGLFDSEEDRLYTDITKLVMHAENNREEAVEMFDAVADSVADSASGYKVALVYARLGETDRVFAHLKRSYEDHDGNMTYLKAVPAFEKYHTDPRFKDLLKKMGLDE